MSDFFDIRQYGSLMRKGHAQDIHFLTPKGANIIAEYLGVTLSDIRHPKNSHSIFTNDYFHRVSTISTQIAYDEWLVKNDFQSIFFDTYFDKTKGKSQNGKLTTATRMQLDKETFVVPDGVFMYQKGINKLLYCLEVARGKRTKKVVNQLQMYLKATALGLPSVKYNHNKANRVLCTFEHSGTLRAVLDRMKTEEFFQQTNIEKYIFVQEEEKLWNDFNVWQDLHGNEALLNNF